MNEGINFYNPERYDVEGKSTGIDVPATSEESSPSDTSKPEVSERHDATFKTVLFALLPDRGPGTIPAISASTGIAEDEVSSIISRLESMGKLTQAQGSYSFTPEVEHDVRMIEGVEREMQKQAAFDKYRSNPIYQAEIHPTVPFDSAAAVAESGSLQSTRDVSPHEKVYCFEGGVYHVWKEGPRNGEVFFHQKKITESEITTASVDEFTNTTLKLLSDFAESPRSTEMSALHNYILRVCYGDRETIGWEQARFYDLHGDGEKINTIMKELLEQGLERFLIHFAKEHGIEIKGINFQEQAVLPLYYDGMQRKDLRENSWDSSESEIILTHGTYSHILPNLIQMRGLAARDYYESFGIKKYYGGEGQGKGSYTADDVSFWYHKDGKPIVAGGHGSKRAYDFPMMIGIAKEQAEQLRMRLGTMNNEIVVRNYAPIQLITHLFVPSFKIEEIQDLLHQNHITHVHVLPLSQRSTAARYIS